MSDNWTTTPGVGHNSNVTQAAGASHSAETMMLLQKYWGIDNVMLEWRRAKDELDECKEREAALRRAVFEVKFPNKTEGTQRVELGKGYKLKAVYPMTYNCGTKPDDLAKVTNGLNELAALGEEAKFIAQRVVKWMPEISITEYRQLKPEYKMIVDKFVTIKPGSPQLEIEEPKA